MVICDFLAFLASYALHFSDHAQWIKNCEWKNNAASFFRLFSFVARYFFLKIAMQSVSSTCFRLYTTCTSRIILGYRLLQSSVLHAGGVQPVTQQVAFPLAFQSNQSEATRRLRAKAKAVLTSTF